MTTFTDSQINTFLDERIGSFAENLSGLVKIDSESGDPKKANKLDEIVETLEKNAKARGFQTTKVQAVDKERTYPALVAKYEVNPEAPWVLVYNHADVQPEGDREKWEGEDPFSGHIDYEQGIVHGRGATDDKGPLLGTLYALEFLMKNNLLGVNVELVYETAEESGSGGFKKMLEDGLANGVIKHPNHVFVSDTEFKEGHPNLLLSLRGILAARVSLKYAEGTMHSGIFGDNVPSAVEILADLLGTCKDPYNGRVLIPEFYNGVKAPSKAEFAAIRKAGRYMSVDGLKKAATAYVLRDESVEGMLRKTGLEATLAIHTIKGGGFGTGIAPSAEAFVTARLIQGQNPKAIKQNLVQHLARVYSDRTQQAGVPHLYGGVTDVSDLPASERNVPCRIEVDYSHTVNPFKTTSETQYHQKALEAYARFFDKAPLLLFEGGTIGTLPMMQEVFGTEMPFVLLAQSQDTDGYHQEKEHYHLDHARKAIGTVAQYFASL